MKSKFLKLLENKQKAFTLIETLIALFVIMFAVSLLQMVTSTIKSQSKLPTGNSRFSNLIQVIESDKYKFEFTKINKHELTVYSPVQNKIYRFFNKENVLRMTSERGGYVPLLDNIDDVNWNYNKNLLTTKIVMNGHQYEAISLLKHQQKGK